MNSQLFLIFNLCAAAFFLWWFISGRRSSGRAPKPLNLKKGGFSGSDSDSQASEKNLESRSTKNTPPSSGGEISKAASDSKNTISKASSESSSDRPTKNLNILFMYNGHDWDAYAVLGVPAGCSLKLATEKYQDLIKTADPGQLEFFSAAYNAILKKS